MLNIDIIEKKITRNINGTNILDLVTQGIDVTYNPNYTKAIVVPDDLAMRPDLVAQMYCASQSKLGILLKINSISNPFSLDAGEILFIPDSETMTNLLKNPEAEIKNDVRKSFRKQLQDRISKVSEQRKEYLNAVSISDAALANGQGGQNPTQTPLPPNVNQAGNEDQFKVENGKLIFGANVGVCRTKIQQNKSVATIKSRFAQRQIFES
jgi:hypothetical protein